MTGHQMRILIVDDHAIFRAGLRQLLTEELRNAYIAEAGDTAAALKIIREQKWDIILLDINLPDRSGIDLLKNIKQLIPGLPVLMLSMFSEEQYAVRSIRAGASGYLTKDTSPDILLMAIKNIAKGGKYITKSLANTIASHLQSGQQDVPHKSLSDREYDIFIKLATGKTVSEIAKQLLLSVKTVSTYRSRVLKKMNMKTNAELMHYALSNKLI
jgi:DNA-binding NarL/FixJ family response regulator